MDENMDVLNDVMQWFKDRCDGDWEHAYGIKIETLDNPGWYVEISLSETEWAEILLPMVSVDRNEMDWVRYQVGQAKFAGSGGIQNLNEILHGFLSIVNPISK